MADHQQDRRIRVPDARGTVSMPAVACLPMELYAYLRHYYCIFSCESYHISFKYLHATDRKAVSPTVIFPDPPTQQLLEHFHLDVQQAFQT